MDQNKNIIFVPGDLVDWVEVAENIKMVEGFSPTYFLIPRNLIDSYQKFEAAKFGVVEELNRGFGLSSTKILIDEVIIRKLSKFEHNAFGMMNRMDIGNSFSYDDRRELYYSLINHWLNVFEEVKPISVIFNITPHSISE